MFKAVRFQWYVRLQTNQWLSITMLTKAEISACAQSHAEKQERTMHIMKSAENKLFEDSSRVRERSSAVFAPEIICVAIRS